MAGQGPRIFSAIPLARNTRPCSRNCCSSIWIIAAAAETTRHRPSTGRGSRRMTDLVEAVFQQAEQLDAAASSPASHRDAMLGTRIGPYTLRSILGEGGFGIVYLADQEQPIRRRVAVKILKPGMDTKQVLARFEAERHTLALMDHANIARVFDAGTTENGRSYFVMELVQGEPITPTATRTSSA